MKVLRYALDPMTEGCLVKMPRGAHPLSVSVHDGAIVCWAAVNEEESEPVVHQFFLVATGRGFGCVGRFMGTVVVPDETLPHGIAVHLFYGGEA